MNAYVSRPVKEDVPVCYGEKWEATAPECAGGPDATYTHPKDGTHVREMCDFFHSCGAKVQAGRLGAQIIPAAQLTSRTIQPIPLPAAPPAQPPSFREYMAQQQSVQPRVAPMPQSHYLQVQPTPAPQHPSMGYPAPMYQLQYLVPGYLSVPEARRPGQSVWAMLGREVIRALGKAVGHTIANFFDTHPFRLPPGQGGSE